MHPTTENQNSSPVPSAKRRRLGRGVLITLVPLSLMIAAIALQVLLVLTVVFGTKQDRLLLMGVPMFSPFVVAFAVVTLLTARLIPEEKPRRFLQRTCVVLALSQLMLVALG